VILVSLFAISWTYRRHAFGRVLAVLILVLGLAADLALWSASQDEAPYFAQILAGSPGPFAVWAGLWLTWQVAVAFQLLRFGRGLPPIVLDFWTSAYQAIED
jgi:hypothetical protein